MAKLQELPAAVNKTGAQWFKGEIELETNVYNRPTTPPISTCLTQILKKSAAVRPRIFSRSLSSMTPAQCTRNVSSV